MDPKNPPRPVPTALLLVFMGVAAGLARFADVPARAGVTRR